MHKENITIQNEQGNAVTLTLLGLSIAILAGVIVLYYVGKSKPEPVYTPEPIDEQVFETNEEDKENPREGWRTYTSDTYEFSVEFPQGWVVATGTLSTGDPAISIYPATIDSTSTVYSHQDVANHVSVYPLGVATEGILNKSKSSNVIITIPQAAAIDYVLTTGRPWATKGTFERYPNSWNSSGFVFSRLVIESEEIVYMRGKEVIEQYEFDPVTGDHIERSGFVDTKLREQQEEILKSLKFIDKDDSTNETGERNIIIESPIEGDIIESPLRVKGSVPGGWYFGDEYPIRIETNDGTIVTQSFITGFEGTDSRAYIPFEVSLVFETPNATSGVLIIGEDDMENSETELVVSVLFNSEE